MRELLSIFLYSRPYIKLVLLCARQQSVTLWNLGDSRHPLKADHVSEFVSEFSHRDSGMNALYRIDNDCAGYHVQRVAEGQKYHSLDAAAAAAKADFAMKVDELATKQGTWPKVEAAGRVKQCCFSSLTQASASEMLICSAS